MCWGSDDDQPQSAQLVSATPPEDFIDFFDEITGTKTITVMEKGKKVRKHMALPRSKEEQALFEFAETMAASAVKNIKELYAYDPSSVVNYQPFIERIANLNHQTIQELSQITNLGNIQADVDEFKAMNNNINNQVFAKRYGDLEEGLSHSGLSNSTAAQQTRAALVREESLARQQGNIASTQYAEQLAQERLKRNAATFGLNEEGRSAQKREAEMGYNFERQKQDDLEERRLQAIRENMNQFQVASGIQGVDMNKKLASKAPELSNQMFQLSSVDAISRANAENAKRASQFSMDTAAYNAKPPSIGTMAFGALGNVAGSMFNAPSNTVAGRAGNKVGSYFGF
jgi:hypothetical protein